MSETNLFPVSNSFDQDFGSSPVVEQYEQGNYDIIPAMIDSVPYDHSNSFLDYQDPLKHAYKVQFQPLNLGLNDVHFVEPHFVDGYFRKDGTYVEGYFRDGDGNTNINRPIQAGGGYIRSNPDGNPFNNLG